MNYLLESKDYYSERDVKYLNGIKDCSVVGLVRVSTPTPVTKEKQRYKWNNFFLRTEFRYRYFLLHGITEEECIVLRLYGYELQKLPDDAHVSTRIKKWDGKEDKIAYDHFENIPGDMYV